MYVHLLQVTVLACILLCSIVLWYSIFISSPGCPEASIKTAMMSLVLRQAWNLETFAVGLECLHLDMLLELQNTKKLYVTKNNGVHV